MRREDIQPAYYAMPEVTCPHCGRVGKMYKLHGDLGVLYADGWDDCTYGHFLSWASLDDLKEQAA